MLDAYIIDEIRKEELKRERDFERRRIWLELPLPPPPARKIDNDEHERGPIVIPFRPEIEDSEEDAA